MEENLPNADNLHHGYEDVGKTIAERMSNYVGQMFGNA